MFVEIKLTFIRLREMRRIIFSIYCSEKLTYEAEGIISFCEYFHHFIGDNKELRILKIRSNNCLIFDLSVASCHCVFGHAQTFTSRRYESLLSYDDYAPKGTKL